jgi:hypothetical protein
VIYVWIYLYKSELNNKFENKINYRIKSYDVEFQVESILKEKSIIRRNNHISKNELYTSKINYSSSRIKPKYILNV